jgi:hypothetical protein
MPTIFLTLRINFLQFYRYKASYINRMLMFVNYDLKHKF